MDKLSILSCK
jgi:hypothetical protein